MLVHLQYVYLHKYEVKLRRKRWKKCIVILAHMFTCKCLGSLLRWDRSHWHRYNFEKRVSLDIVVSFEQILRQINSDLVNVTRCIINRITLYRESISQRNEGPIDFSFDSDSICIDCISIHILEKDEIMSLTFRVACAQRNGKLKYETIVRSLTFQNHF